MKLLNVIKNLILEVSNYRVANFNTSDYKVQVFQSAHQKDERNGFIKQLSFAQTNQIIDGTYRSGVPTNDIFKSIKKNIDTIINKFQDLDKLGGDNRIVFIQEMPNDYPSDRIEYVLSAKFYHYPSESIVLTIITSAFSGQNSDKGFFKGAGQQKVRLTESEEFKNIPVVFLT